MAKGTQAQVHGELQQRRQDAKGRGLGTHRHPSSWSRGHKHILLVCVTGILLIVSEQKPESKKSCRTICRRFECIRPLHADSHNRAGILAPQVTKQVQSEAVKLLSLGSGLGGTNPEKDGCRFCTSPISKCAPGRRGYLCLMVATGSAPGHRACDRPGNGTQGHLTPKGEHADNCLPSSGSRQSTKLRLKRPGSPSCSNALLRDLEQGLNFWVKWEKQCLSVY